MRLVAAEAGFLPPGPAVVFADMLAAMKPETALKLLLTGL
jgi:hypothetical protein